jgi:transposase
MQRKGISFEGQNIFIGIDVHLKKWSVAIMTTSGFVEKFSQASGADILFSHLKKNYPKGCYYSVYEAGFCGFSLHYSLESLGLKNIVINPADVPSTQKDSVHKTDPVDALKLVKSLQAGMLRPIYIPNKQTIMDRELPRTRDAIVKDTVRWKIRVKHLLYRHGINYPEPFANTKTHWNKRFVQWLEEDVTLLMADNKEALLQQIAAYKQVRSQQLAITRRIREMSRNEYYKDNMQLLTSIPGIGFHTAIAFLTEMGDIHRFSNEKEFASFIGIVPTCHSSGEKDHVGEMTFRGNKHLTKKLIESAWIAIRKDVALASCFGQYCRRMPDNKAIVRIARKLSNRILTVLKRQTKYVNGQNT